LTGLGLIDKQDEKPIVDIFAVSDVIVDRIAAWPGNDVIVLIDARPPLDCA
jgi:hypothetical protein